MMCDGAQALEETGSSPNAALSWNVLSGALSVGAVLVAPAVIDESDRRTMLLFGVIGTTTAHLLVGSVGPGLPEGNAWRPWLPMVCVLARIGIDQGTVGPPVGLMTAEIHPLACGPVRGGRGLPARPGGSG